MKLLQTANPPAVLANNSVPVVVDSVKVTEDGKLEVRLRTPVLMYDFTAVTDVLKPGMEINITTWLQL
jgi:hypothetical protein